MGETQLERSIRERRRALRRAVGAEIRRARLDAGLSIREVGHAAAIDPSHLSRVESGDRDLSQAGLVAVAAVIGADVSTRLYPSSGPRVRDRVQVRMLEATLEIRDVRWDPRLEVPVYRPVHGVIDLVFHDRRAGDVVASEAHGMLAAVDTQLRWAAQKADALPSATGWPWGALDEPRIGRLLLLRSTAANRVIARDLGEVFRAAYPADPEVAYAALTGRTGAWPGNAVLWVEVDGTRTRVLPGSPRGIAMRRGGIRRRPT